MLWILIGLSLNISTAHAQDCLDVYFGNGDGMCLNMNKDGNNYKIYPTRYFWLNNQNVVCYVILPNNVMQRLDSCKGTFTYNGKWFQTITISAMYNANNTIYNNRFPTEINFTNWSWGNSRNTTYNYYNNCNYNNCLLSTTSKSSTSISKTYNNKLELESNDLFPVIEEWINLSIETDSDYTGSLSLYAKYRSLNDSQRSTISNRSSTYFYDYSSTRSNGKYEMTKSDNGNITLKNLIKFKKYGYYRIYVKDRFGRESYIQFSVENTKSKKHPYGYGYSGTYNSSNNSNSSSSKKKNSNDLEISAYPSNPDIKQRIRVNIETDDDYTWKIYFKNLKYKSNNSSSWKDVSMTSSSYVYDYSDEWKNGYYKMTRSDDWEKDLYRLIKFNKQWYYRIYIEDTYGNESYVQIHVSDDDEDYYDSYNYSSSSSSRNSDYNYDSNFSSSQMSKVREVFYNRDNTIAQMQRLYPNLKKDYYWISLSNNFANDMKDIVNNKRYRNMDSYDDFLERYNDRYRYTMQNI